MHKIKKIGIVGQGFVGGSVNEFFKNRTETFTYDLNGNCNCDSLEELVKKSDLIFVCLPTPMQRDGSCDLSIVKNCINDIFKINKHSIAVIKSTVEPGTVEKLITQHGNRIIFNPEFLTEANAIDDFKNQDRIILGGFGQSIIDVESFFKEFFPKSRVVTCSPSEAEMVKYITNTFLATKVSYANEIYDICTKLNIDYNQLIEIFTLDKRLGFSHWSVPGPDGKRGFGGSCFPKDISALISFASNNDIKSPLLKSVWERNKKIDRPSRDWELLLGRAVSKNEDS